jgi:transcriptional antiterminator NusG
MNKNLTILNHLDYNNWYVIHVTNNREPYICSFAKKFLDTSAVLTYFSREIIHKKNNNYSRFTTPLFPGYIFVYKDVDKIIYELKSYLPNEYIQSVKFNNTPAKVLSSEIRLLFHYSDKNGVFKLSEGIRKGDSVIITEGPLKNLKTNILFINKKKKKAKVKFSLFKQELLVSLGLDIIEKEYNISYHN